MWKIIAHLVVVVMLSLLHSLHVLWGRRPPTRQRRRGLRKLRRKLRRRKKAKQGRVKRRRRRKVLNKGCQ
jgi:hypothetical protein